MSNIYHTEPPTQGKVVIKTSYGDIDIELWPKEAPLACRNFIQLCLEGYYDNSSVHRIIKEFMVQMGDPTGTGNGGESIWGRPFKDELHGRLKFNHRGQVAMANDNAPNTNRSQFFITLGPCDWLHKKHTIFGKVTGNTVYNLMRMGEADVDDKDKPTEKILFIKAEVIWNPFDDIVPRDLSATNAKIVATLDQKNEKMTKNTKLLSFGDDDEENDVPITKIGKIKSIHDTNEISTKYKSEVDEGLLQEIRSTKPTNTNKLDDNGIKLHSSHSEKKDFDMIMKEQMMEKRRLLDKSSNEKVALKLQSTQADKVKLERQVEKSDDEDDDMENMEKQYTQSMNDKTTKLLEERKREYNKIREDLIRSKRAVKVVTGADAEDALKNEVYSTIEQRRQRFIKRKREHGDRQDETLSKLEAFTSKLRSVKKETKPEEHVREVEAYHGQVLEKDETDDPGLEESWHVGKLKFRRHIDDSYRMADPNSGSNSNP